MACCTLCTRPRRPYIGEFTAFSTAEASAMSDATRPLTDCRFTSSSASSKDSLTSDSGWAGTSIFKDRRAGSTGMVRSQDERFSHASQRRPRGALEKTGRSAAVHALRRPRVRHRRPTSWRGSERPKGAGITGALRRFLASHRQSGLRCAPRRWTGGALGLSPQSPGRSGPVGAAGEWPNSRRGTVLANTVLTLPQERASPPWRGAE